MSYRKRFLATVLAVLMVVSTMATMGVSANTNFTDVSVTDGRDLHDAISVLSDLGIAKGRVTADGETIFAGDETVTREQFALFTARIITGTPQFFAEQDQEALKSLQGLFSDMGNADVTYAAAIMYCVENGIINGYPDGTFNPKGTIELREAIKMLVTALGYTGLAYPQGYLSKASEQTVALIGNFVKTRDFEFTGRASTDKITRNDMAKLLYNFLLSSYYKVELAWNGVTGRYESRVNTSPTIEKFGITPIVGYIVGVDNYAMRLDVRDYNDLKSGTRSIADTSNQYAEYDARPTTFTGTPITPSQIAAAGRGDLAGFDAQIAYKEWVTNANATNAAWSPQREIRTTLKSLGLDDTIDPRQHLGKKVIAYRRLNTLTSNSTTLPSAVVVGSKEITNNANNSSDFTPANFPTTNTVPEQRVGQVTTLTLDKSDSPFNQREEGSAPKDLNLAYNLYAYTVNGRLVSDNGSKWEARGIASGTALIMESNVSGDLLAFDPLRTGNADDNNPNRQLRDNAIRNGIVQIRRRSTNLQLYENSIEKELAKMIKNEGHYELWYVDNGYDRFGNKEFFYEFIPYRVGYNNTQTSGSDTRVKMENAQVFNVERIRYSAVSSSSGNTETGPEGVNVIAADGVTFTRGEAYLYTYFGAYRKDLRLHEQLTRITAGSPLDENANHAVVQYTTAGTVAFRNLSARPTVSFTQRTGSRAIGGIYQNHVVGAFTADNSYALWVDPTDSNIVILRREVKEAAAIKPTAPEYAVALSTNEDPSRAGVSRPVGYPDGSIGYIFDLYNASQPNRLNFVLKGGAPADDILSIAPGEYLALFENLDGSYSVNVLSERTSNGGTPIATTTGIGHARETDDGTNILPTLTRYFNTKDDPKGFYASIAVNGLDHASYHSMGKTLPSSAVIHYDTSIRRVTINSAIARVGSTDSVTQKVTSPSGRINPNVAGTGSGQIPANNLMAYANSNTTFIVFGPASDTTIQDLAQDSTLNHWKAARFTMNTLDTQLFSGAYRAAFIAGSNNIADVVFISTVIPVGRSITATQYGVIVDNDVNNPNRNDTARVTINGIAYHTRTAYIYSDASGTKFEQVYSPVSNADPLSVGAVVSITDTSTLTANGQTYKLANTVSRTLAGTNPWGDNDSNGRGVVNGILGLPNSLSTNVATPSTAPGAVATYFGRVTQYTENSHFTLSKYGSPSNAQIVVTMPGHNRTRSVFVRSTSFTTASITAVGNMVISDGNIRVFVPRFVVPSSDFVSATTTTNALTRLTQGYYNRYNSGSRAIFAVVDMIDGTVINVSFIIVNPRFNDGDDRFSDDLRNTLWSNGVNGENVSWD